MNTESYIHYNKKKCTNLYECGKLTLICFLDVRKYKKRKLILRSKEY